jgi:hypothetical protein
MVSRPAACVAGGSAVCVRFDCHPTCYLSESMTKYVQLMQCSWEESKHNNVSVNFADGLLSFDLYLKSKNIVFQTLNSRLNPESLTSISKKR